MTEDGGLLLRWRALCALSLLALLTACASAPGASGPALVDGPSPSALEAEPLLSRKDPWENFIRSIYGFNESGD